ncbi:hypothetical protein PLICRDRAFT_698073 [Plicaturopsis crispa FD-325 SS-3]|nr:hypothetical protein PLICRDRAFT_698073 [Plicaturopsis crispa FD-325 SS-3]
MATTATMLEPYDTQMLDYSADLDVHMHTDGSTDAWMREGESEMEDDDAAVHTHVSEHESVEVDMDSYDVEAQEYEMADEAGNYPPDGGELVDVDVDVYDASHMPTPAVPPIPLDSSLIPPHEGSHTPLSGFHNASALPTPDDPVSVPEEIPAPSGAAPVSLTEEPVVSSPQIQPLAESASLPDNSAVAVPQGDASHHDGLVSDGAPAVEPEYHLESSSMHEPADPQDEVATTSHPENAAVVHAAEANSPVEEGAPQHSAEDIHDAEEHASSGDPHEISEGVYIDPPPAVLLTLPSSEHPEVSLFNQPDPGSPSPARQVLTLLLQHRPTLYYEPLSHVFEALRLEEYVASLPGFHEGELMLEVHDLQLAVSEDNIYAREVTLHDFDILHDGSDIAGPLRLTLHISSPRFIARFHALRDQIARLNVADSGADLEETDGGHEAAEVEHEYEHEHDGESHTEHAHIETVEEAYHEEHAHEGHEAEPSAQEILQGDEAVQQATEDEHGHPTTAQEETTEHSGRQEEEAGSAKTQESHPQESTIEANEIHHSDARNDAHDEVLESEAHVLENDNEYTAPDASEENPAEPLESDAVLDADAVHTTDDAEPLDTSEQQTEYAEYVDPEEDDQQSGEALPDEFGGEVSTLPSVENGLSTEAPGAAHDSQSLTGGEPEPAAADASVALADDSYNEADSTLTDNQYNDDQDQEVDAAQQTDFGDGTPYTGYSHLEGTDDIDESDSNFVTMLENAADSTDPIADTTTIGNSEPELFEKIVDNPEDDDDQDWDEDGEGEEVDPSTWAGYADADAASNQSSTTMSSTGGVGKTAKRGFDEIEGEDGNEAGQVSPPSSPDSKRVRIH